MKQVNIIKQGQVSNSGVFASEQEAQDWLSSHLSMGSFGVAAHSIPAVLDSEGNELSPEVQIPCEYEIEILDISAQVEQEAINAAALKLLADSDWYCARLIETGVEIPEDIKAARAAARLSIVRG